MEFGSGPLFTGETGPIFNDEDPKEAAAGAGIFSIVGGVLGGVTATAGSAAVVVSLPGILAGAAAGGAVYGTAVGIKWGFKKVKKLMQR